MIPSNLDARYWQSRYVQGDTPWDIGGLSPAIQDFLETLEDKSLRILIPGAGKAYEARWLKEKGFEQVFVCDWAEAAIHGFSEGFPEFPASHLLVSDFFKLEGHFDLIVEQTFVSALPPELWSAWAQKCAELLGRDGRVAGLLFASPFDKPGPPFGADQATYHNILSAHFHQIELAPTTRSISPRLGNELFFVASNASH